MFNPSQVSKVIPRTWLFLCPRFTNKSQHGSSSYCWSGVFYWAIKMEQTSLYLLKDRDHDLVKIGISKNVKKRIWQLRADNIDVRNSSQYIFPDRESAEKAEKYLHEKFKKVHRPKAHKENGYSEWFDYSACDIADAFIYDNFALFGCTYNERIRMPLPRTQSAKLHEKRVASLKLLRSLIEAATKNESFQGIIWHGLLFSYEASEQSKKIFEAFDSVRRDVFFVSTTTAFMVDLKPVDEKYFTVTFFTLPAFFSPNMPYHIPLYYFEEFVCKNEKTFHEAKKLLSLILGLKKIFVHDMDDGNPYHYLFFLMMEKFHSRTERMISLDC